MYSLTSGLPVDTADCLECDPSVTVCFTGHRPDKIVPFRNRISFTNLTYAYVELFLYRSIELAEQLGYVNFISGLAKGVDLWAANGVIKRKKLGSDISLIGVMPFLRHAERLYGKSREALTEAEINADQLITVNPDPNITFGKRKAPGFSSELYSDRNRFMVDNSAAVIAFYDGGSDQNSGTGQTVRYAQRSGKPVYRFGINEIYDLMERSMGDISAARELIGEWELHP